MPVDNGQQNQNIAAAVQDVSERVALLVREEIELAKAEVTQKMTRLVKGAVVGVAAGIFVLVGLMFLLQSGAWAFWDYIWGSTHYWLGFLTMAILLFILGGLAGYLAAKALKAGSNPAPTMAIEEAKKIRATVTSSGSQGGR